MAANLGKVMITTEGKYVTGIRYSEKSIVTYKGNTYISLKETAEEPADDGVNWIMLLEGVPIATADTVGKSKPDGETITIDENGTLHGASQVPVGVTFVDLESSGEALPEKVPVNADQLGGQSPEYYASADDITKLKSEVSVSYNELERDSITQFRRYGYLSEPGWYRVATYHSNSQTSAKGSAANGVEFNIKRSFNNNAPEEHQILLVGQYRQQHFKSLYDCSISNQQLITKIRYVWSDTKAYIDIYYNAATRNTLSVSINKAKDAVGYDWELYGEAYLPLVEEMIEGENISTIYEIPANANPATDLDLQNYLPLSGGSIRSSSNTPFSVHSTYSGEIYIGYYEGDNVIGSIGFVNSEPCVWLAKKTGSKRIMYDSITKPVVISESAPTDTTALWYNPSTKAVKSYVDGAWT